MSTDGPEQRCLDAEERADLEFRQNVFLGDELRDTLIDIARVLSPATHEPRYSASCGCSEASLVHGTLLPFDYVRELHQLDFHDWRVLHFSPKGRLLHTERFRREDLARERYFEVGP